MTSHDHCDALKQEMGVYYLSLPSQLHLLSFSCHVDHSITPLHWCVFMRHSVQPFCCGKANDKSLITVNVRSCHTSIGYVKRSRDSEVKEECSSRNRWNFRTWSLEDFTLSGRRSWCWLPELQGPSKQEHTLVKYQ